MHKILGVAAAFSLMIFTSAGAAPLEAPKDTPILVISGNITSTNVDGTAQFDRAMLEALGTVVVNTKTPWFNGVSKFEGVSLDALMKHVGAEGSTVTATALNDYVTTIPMEDFATFGTIMALKRDGEYMSVRDKGPLFIIYPFDDNPALQNEVYFGRSAWQLAKLNVE